ncbi:branched-chain amino acid ABC transporter substrate-binding protein [Bradyrhizobium sp. AS23.2]|nr:branched-chain amino acid ABC transporter substrate-binding protein [Bradyrhizobium sp. AS23.2]
MSRLCLSTILAVVAGLSAGIGAAHAAEAVRIGIAAPFSGAAATYGQDFKRGAELALQEINAKGGILNGRKVELVYEDDKGSPQGGVAAVQKLMAVDRVNAITGGTNSSVVLAESSVTRNRILQVNVGAQADAITDQGSPWLFQINNTVSMNSQAFNSYIVGALKPKTVAYMGENTEFNKTVLELLKSSLKDAGIALVNVSIYDADTSDFTSIITKIKSLNPDLLYVSDGYPARAAQAWKQIRQLGGFPMEVMSPGTVVPGALASAGGAMDGVITGDIFMMSAPGEAAKAFVDAYSGKYNVSPGKGNLIVYEAVHLIAAAMDKAGTDSDYAKISGTIRDNAWPSPRGELRFDAKGRARAPYFYIQRVKDGKLTQLEVMKSH